jgi:Domain of unknown function (DUF4260)
MKTNTASFQPQALSPEAILRLENAAIAAFCVWGYAQLSGTWWLFVGLFLLPDLGMVGYLLGNRVDANSYNFFHTHSLPMGLFVLGALLSLNLAMQIGLVWFFHIAFDRAIGYGLKRSTGFKHTHIG